MCNVLLFAKHHFILKSFDCFLLFREECEECDVMEARLETLACRHKGRLNVARVDKGGAGAVTARRFEVATPPAFIL